MLIQIGDVIKAIAAVFRIADFDILKKYAKGYEIIIANKVATTEIHNEFHILTPIVGVITSQLVATLTYPPSPSLATTSDLTKIATKGIINRKIVSKT